MGKLQCCDKVGIKRGRWTKEEDDILRKHIEANGEGHWRSLPKNAGLLRCGKSCRLRWINYLRSDLKRGNISAEEEDTIIRLQASLGNRWSVIATHLPGRTDNEIKNYWNSHLRKKTHIHLQRPDTHTCPSPVASTATAKKHKRTDRRRRIDRTATKENENDVPEPLGNQKEDNSNSNGVTVPEPSTPTTEKEVLSSTIPRVENNVAAGHAIVPEPSAEEATGCEEMVVDVVLCMDDIIVGDCSAIAWGADKEGKSSDRREREKMGSRDGNCELGSSDGGECPAVNLWEDWDAAVSGIADGGWGREENTLAWLWDDTTMDKEV